MNDCFDDFRCLLDHASDLAQVVSRNGTLHYTNPTWLQTLGYGAADVANLSFWQILHPEDHDRYRTICDHLQPHQSSSSVQLTLLTRLGQLIRVEGTICDRSPDGMRSHLWSLWRIVQPPDSQAHLNGNLEKDEDLEQKLHHQTAAFQSANLKLQQIQQDLQTQKDFLQRVIDAVPSSIYVKDLERRFVLVNQTMANFHNTTPAITLDKRFGEFSCNLDAVQIEAFHQEDRYVIRTGHPLVKEDYFVDLEHNTRCYQTTLKPFLNAEGEVQGLLGNTVDITAHKNTETALNDSEARLQRLAANVPGMLVQYVLHPDGSDKFTYVSPACREICELEPQEMLQDARTVWAMVHPSDVSMLQQAIAQSHQNLESFDVYFRLIPASGRLKWLHGKSSPERQANGDLVFDGLIMDVSDRKAAEAQLHSNEELLSLFFAQSLHGFFFMMLDEPIYWNEITDKDAALDYIFAHDRITRINLAMLKQYGATEAQFIGLTPADFFAHDLQYGRDIWRQFLDAGRLHVETEERKFDGTPIWIEGDYIALYDTEGRLIGHFGVQRDVSDRKTAETALKISEQRLQSVIRSAPLILFTLDQNGRVTFSDGQGLEPLGLKPGELVGRTAIEIYPDIPEITEAISRALAGEVVIYDKTINGNYYSSRYNPLLDDRGNVIGMVGVALDITDRATLAVERSQAQAALHQSEQRLRQVIESAPVVLYALDNQGRFTLSEGKGLEALGLRPGQVVGQSIFELYQHYPQILHHIQQALTGEEVQYVEKVGEITFDARYSPLHDKDDNLIGVTGVAVDITERVRAEAEVLKTLQREKELGEMKSRFVTMVSHEFRTPLAIIQSATEIMHHYPLNAAEQREYFDQIYTAIKHMTYLLEDVLLIGKLESGKMELQNQWIDLSDICLSLVAELRLVYGQDYQFQFIVDGTAVSIFIDPKMIKQIFSNLLSNAAKYSPKGGKVRFNLTYQSDQVVFQVQDQGIGIPVADQAQIFETFYRAKNVGNIQGTGLGMAIVKRCVDLLGGTITVESVAMIGTTFTVLLPY